MPTIDSASTTAIISGLFTVICTLITVLVGRAILNRKRLQEKLNVAQADIAYLLHVEALHCEYHRKESGRSYKMLVRQEATHDGLIWSGRFTPGRVKASPSVVQPRQRLLAMLARWRSVGPEQSKPRA